MVLLNVIGLDLRLEGFAFGYLVIAVYVFFGLGGVDDIDEGLIDIMVIEGKFITDESAIDGLAI